MADSYDYIQPTGVIVPDTQDLFDQVAQEFRDALGQDLDVTPSTPQGVLVAAETLARANTARNNAVLANQINPQLAGGLFLDAIWKLTGGQRRAATQSVIASAILTGVPGVSVPAGSQAQTAAGDVFYTLSVAILGADGTAVVDLAAQDFGPVPAAIGALNQVVSAVLGWETITNPTAAALGINEESDLSSRARRRNTLALQGVALPEAITSALYDVDGVRSLTFRENVTDATATIDGISLVEHSIWACVDGGSDLDVATALLANKSLGANYNGATTVNVTEPASGQVYAVKFQRPTVVPIIARVTVRAAGAAADPYSVIPQAIADYAAGLLEGEVGFTVGTSVSPFELAGAVNREVPGFYVQKVEVSLASSIAYTTAEIPLALNQIASISAQNVVVVVL